MTEKGFDCEHNRHRWEQCEACAEERGYRAGIEAAVECVYRRTPDTRWATDLMHAIRALAPAAPKAPERDGSAGSGAVFCDPTTLSESQLRDTIGACLEHLNRRFPPKAPERGACDECGGDGWVYNKACTDNLKCPSCRGTGTQPAREKGEPPAGPPRDAGPGG